MIPNLKEERQLFRKGYGFIAGIDEAGRGPLAGPVVVGIVVFEEKNLKKWLKFNIRDSKKLSERQRKEALKMIKKEAIEVNFSRVSERVIDKINIRQATLLAMRRAFLRLKTPIDFILIDGKDTLKNLPVNQKAIIGGDEKTMIVAAASIVAKESRDNIMRRYAKKYLKYGFESHKGYGTKMHFEMIKKYGSCKIHRKSFHPIKDIKK